MKICAVVPSLNPDDPTVSNPKALGNSERAAPRLRANKQRGLCFLRNCN